MNETEANAHVIAQTACMMVAAMGMQAANQVRIDRGEGIAYDEAAFSKLPDEFYPVGNSWNFLLEARHR